MFKHRPILAGKSDLHQLHLIFELVGAPTEATMPGWADLPGFKKDGVSSYGSGRGTLRAVFRPLGANDQALSLLSQLLLLDWRKRVNAIDALQHPYFTTEPLPLRPGDIPQFEESHELDRRKFRDQQAALPPAPKGGDVGVGPRAGDWAGGPVNGYPPMHPHRGAVPPPPPPSHPPPSRHESSRVPHSRAPPPPGPPRGGLPERRQPAWQRGPPDTSLPPRPPPPGGGGGGGGWAGEGGHHGGWAGDPPPDARPRHGPGPLPPLAHRGNGAPPPPPAAHAGHKDTYIPSYGNGDGRRERYDAPAPLPPVPPPGHGDGRRERYDAPPPRYDRGRHGEWADERRWGTPGWDHGRDWAGDRPRRRSRSPGGAYGKGRPERDRSREAYRR